MFLQTTIKKKQYFLSKTKKLLFLKKIYSTPFIIFQKIKNIIPYIRHFIFPPLCPGCGTFVPSIGFCSQCWPHLSWIWGQDQSNQCLLCSHPFMQHGLCSLSMEEREKITFLGDYLSYGSIKNGNIKSISTSFQDTFCFSCACEIPYFHKHFSLWSYGPLSRKIIFALKHGGQRALGPFLGRLLVPIALKYPIDYIIPMPLHEKRLFHRGFNQMSIVGKYLSQYTGIPLLEGVLRRQYNTPSQGGLSPSERLSNVYHAFTSKDFSLENGLIPQCCVLLLDDVFTTGASLNACSRILMEHNVQKVFCATLSKVL